MSISVDTLAASPRYMFVDATRAFAALLVNLSHATMAFLPLLVARSRRGWLPAAFWDVWARPSVPLLLMISGVVLLDPQRSTRESTATFFRKRLVKVGVPLLAWSVIYQLWSVYMHGKSLTVGGALLEIIGPPIIAVTTALISFAIVTILRRIPLLRAIVPGSGSDVKKRIEAPSMQVRVGETP